VLSAVHEVVQAAKGAGKWVGMCGEMASHTLCTLVLLGFGLDDLSMGPFFTRSSSASSARWSYAAARNIARDGARDGHVKEVKGYLFDGMKSLGIIELMENVPLESDPRPLSRVGSGSERVAFGGSCAGRAAAAKPARQLKALGPSPCAAPRTHRLQARAHDSAGLPAPALPAAARPFVLSTGGTLAVRPRPETESRVGV